MPLERLFIKKPASSTNYWQENFTHSIFIYKNLSKQLLHAFSGNFYMNNSSIFSPITEFIKVNAKDVCIGKDGF